VRKGEYEVVFRKHAIFRAEEREIPWELIEATVNCGKFERFGKHGVKIRKKFECGKLVCVGEIANGQIRIVTITLG